MSNIDNFQINNDKIINGHFPIEKNNSQIEPILKLTEFQGNNNLKEVFINNDVNNNKNYIFGNDLNFNNTNNNIMIMMKKKKTS